MTSTVARVGPTHRRASRQPRPSRTFAFFRKRRTIIRRRFENIGFETVRAVRVLKHENRPIRWRSDFLLRHRFVLPGLW
jgi:hypothetical protein